ncbi:type II toxin-antitoxin system Phd/YefM family antitoxin [Erwinia sp. CPCC 100877]|nr:type II toxin-antitoxin system Phd/YefM family antitoxin [Erwinia sp. CPCC 100877]
MKNKAKQGLSYSITEVKQSPMTIFKKAQEKDQGIYIYNRNAVAGVILSAKQYEMLVNKKVEKTKKYKRISNLKQMVRETIAFGSLITTKNLDEQLVSLGFTTKKVGQDDYTEMMQELNETGKIKYDLQKKEDRTKIFAEVIGEQSNESSWPDKLVVKKIYIRTI